jgi:hypothetical protein
LSPKNSSGPNRISRLAKNSSGICRPRISSVVSACGLEKKLLSERPMSAGVVPLIANRISHGMPSQSAR